VESHAVGMAPVTACAEKGACGGADEQSPVALMQLKLGVRTGSLSSRRMITADEPEVFGRTILSADPRATAEWVAKYYKDAEVLPSFGECEEAERAAVLLHLGDDFSQLMVFVKPITSLHSDLNPNVMIPRIEQTVLDMFRGMSNYTSWYDAHDGFRSDSFLLEEALADGYSIGNFKHVETDGSVNSANYIMFFFPHTMYGVQNANRDQGDLPEGMPEFFLEDCRGRDDGDYALSLLEHPRRRDGVPSPSPPDDGERERVVSPLSWWKGTFMANNPGKAADFAVKVLNATEVPNPYSQPVVGCTSAAWVQFEVSGFQLHFVNSAGYQPHEDTIKAFTQRVLSNRDLKAGHFDPYMYNSFIMTVKSLDPYVERLQAQSLDFLLVKAGEEQLALFISVPDNDITFQLRSAHLSVEAPTPVEMCTQQFGGY